MAPDTVEWMYIWVENPGGLQAFVLDFCCYALKKCKSF